MSNFYGTVVGSAATNATRRGSTFIRTSAQSWDGSVMVVLYYADNALNVVIESADGSEVYGSELFRGTLDELKKRLKGGD